MAQDLPLAKTSDLNELQNYLDRMKHVGDLPNVLISKYSDLHVQISTTLIRICTEFIKLVVIGEQVVAPSDEHLSAQSRSKRAVLRGDANSVLVSVQKSPVSPGKARLCILWDSSTGCFLDSYIPVFIPHCKLPVINPGCG